jgi:hypothetical protein
LLCNVPELYIALGFIAKFNSPWISKPRPYDHICKLCIYYKITQQFGRLGTPLIVNYPRAARETAHKNRCGPLPWNVRRPLH